MACKHHREPIWHDEHDYNAQTGTCRRKWECRTCGELGWSQPHLCDGGGDGPLCLENRMKMIESIRGARRSTGGRSFVDRRRP